MLKKTPEWYRIVNPRPDDETIEKRKLAVTDLIERLSAAEDYQLLVPCAAGVSNGFESGFNQDSPLVQAVFECISSHQPAFIGDLSENALEYRVCCAIALGEILTRDEAEGGIPQEDAQLAGSLFVSAMGMRSKVTMRYLQIVLQDLEDVAFSALERTAAARRQRRGLNLQGLDKLEVPGDIPTFWQNLLPQLKACIENLEQNAAMDREELDVLWWLHNGFSETVDQPLVALAPGVAALCCGAEVANQVITPPLETVRQMVLHASEKGREKSELSELPLEQMVGQWEDRIWNLLAPTDSDLRQVAQDFPALFPLSWLCLRLRDSQGTSGWNQEFTLKTGLDPTQSYRPGRIAFQAFNERVAQRIYSGK